MQICRESSSEGVPSTPVGARFVALILVTDVRLVERLATGSTAPKRRQDLVVQNIIQCNRCALGSRENWAAGRVPRTELVGLENDFQSGDQRNEGFRGCRLRLICFSVP